MSIEALPVAPPLRNLGKHKPAITKGQISVKGVSVLFGQGKTAHLAVDDASMEIPPGQFVCLLGPSGCGKSTLLNCVAGFEAPTAGTVEIDDTRILGPSPDKGMVFQQYSLFPWKTVLANVAFGPRMIGHSPHEAEGIARTFLGMVGLSDFADRFPATLSGGMKQRVGIARALANQPSVLLMDEPFGALDAQTRVMMQSNLLQLWEQFRTTVLFVTHDVDEAIFLADRVCVMSASPGRIIGDLAVKLPRPRTAETYTDEEFVELKRQCIELIRSESLRAFEQQNRGHAA